ncbi:hypothetical protein JQ596_09870 [Bradyrhizobium manausense]|uniref:hypothetical protein n=1 Tax=Bradyrhizobium TaxID=374 RepID=UPI001BAD2CF7|nr:MULTISPECIES: hypothetical protein [Bradyrhizobium]MBR0825844.1 hypothetical protein [Bradyrhizobium manausense]UVO31217.1 hypothetical protein KUF59_11480 [Bradyrhizobium arachidis]
MLRGFVTSIVLALVMPQLAMAETMSFGDSIGMLAKSCGAEIVANCRGVNPDSTRLKECLSRNRDVLTPQCQTDYLAAFDAIQKRVAARVTVANACSREIVKVCGGSTKETSKSIPCLISTPKGISNNCLKAVDDAGYR